MTNVYQFPGTEPLTLDDPDETVKSMLWGLLSRYADHADSIPLPRHLDDLCELLLVTDQALNKLEVLRGRLRLEMMEGGA